jgi:hypothetical protein
MSRDGEHPGIERLYTALSNRHRRQVVAYIHSADREAFQIDELVAAMGDREAEPPESADEHRHRTRLSLHHRHLPKLADIGLIDYDHRTGDIRYRGGADSEITELLDLVDAGSASDRLDQYN